MQWIGTLVIIGTIVVLTRLRDEQHAVLEVPQKRRSPAA
jgi:hypothetical protein